VREQREERREERKAWLAQFSSRMQSLTIPPLSHTPSQLERVERLGEEAWEGVAFVDRGQGADGGVR